MDFQFSGNRLLPMPGTTSSREVIQICRWANAPVYSFEKIFIGISQYRLFNLSINLWIFKELKIYYVCTWTYSLNELWRRKDSANAASKWTAIIVRMNTCRAFCSPESAGAVGLQWRVGRRLRHGDGWSWDGGWVRLAVPYGYEAARVPPALSAAQAEAAAQSAFYWFWSFSFHLLTHIIWNMMNYMREHIKRLFK